MTSTTLLERLYAENRIAEAHVLQVAIGVARGGTLESGGCIRPSEPRKARTTRSPKRATS